jgi:hypothetical protein
MPSATTETLRHRFAITVERPTALHRPDRTAVGHEATRQCNEIS